MLPNTNSKGKWTTENVEKLLSDNYCAPFRRDGASLSAQFEQHLRWPPKKDVISKSPLMETKMAAQDVT